MIDPSAQIPLLARLMDVTSLRSDVIAQNIANVNTPGYQAKEVRFEDALASALGRGSINSPDPTVQSTPGLAARNDGNNVDIDRELGDSAKNSLLFELYAQLLSTQISQMNSAIKGQ
jgi:flagellar basal-body rod protein FlgB